MNKLLILLSLLSPISALAQNHAIIVSSAGTFADIDSQGRLYVNTSVASLNFYAVDPGDVNAATASTDNPIILIVNPSTATIKAKLQYRAVGCVVVNVATVFRLYKNAVITSSGTVASVSKITTAADTAQTKAYTLPTLSSLGTRIDSHAQGQNTNPIQIRDDGQFEISPGENIVLTAAPTSNNRAQAISIKFTEEAI